MKFLRYFLFLINLLAPVCLISMEKSGEANTSEYSKNALKIDLDGKKLELALANVWRHITSFRLNEGKVSGFHFFSNKGLSSYEFKGQFDSYELFEITPKLWVISKSNKSGFRVCYIVYDGKLIDEPKTFFPSSNFSQDNFLELIQKLPSKISTQRVIYDGLHKVYEITYDYNQKFYIKVVIGSHPNFFIKTIYPVSKEIVSESETKQTKSDLLLCLNEINNKISLRLKNKNFEKTNESLIEAVSGENYDISKIIKLLSSYVNVDERNKLGKTALMIASVKGWLEVVSLLIDYGANVNLVDNNKVSVLDSAIYSCDYLTFLHIFKKDDVKKLPVTTLIDMVGNINKNFSQDKFQDFKLIVSNLIDAGFNIDSVDIKGISALSYCATICSLDLQVAEFFIQCNANIENGDFLNKLADKYNNVGFKKLIQRYKEIKKDYIESLKKHFYDCDDRVLEFLYSLFMFDFRKSESLLKNNLKINLSSDSGFEILKRVIETNNYDLFVLLNLYDSHELVAFYQNCLDYSRKLNVSKQIQDLLLNHFNICEALSQKEINQQNRLNEQKQKKLNEEQSKKKEIGLAYESSVKNDKLTQNVKDFLFSLKNSDQSNLTKPFLYAVEKKSKNIIEFFLNDLKFDLEKNSESVLKMAFQAGDLDVLKLLIASRNLDSQKNLIYGLLILVLDNSNSNNNNIHKSKISLEDVIEIANAFNLNDFIFYSLIRVITDRTRLEGNKENLIKALSDFIYLLNEQQMWDLLQKTLEFDDSTFILLIGKFKKLLGSEDNFINFLNNQNDHGKTLLMLACQFDRVGSVKYLLNCNVNKDIKDFDNKNCLSYCNKNSVVSKIISDELENKKIAQSKVNLEAAQNQHAEEIKNKWIAERKKFEQEKAKLKEESGLSDWLVLFKVVNKNSNFKKIVSIDDFKNCKDDINAVDEQGYTVAHLIAESEHDIFESGNDGIFEFVISQPGFNFEKLSGEEDTTILHCACMNNRVVIAKNILEKYPELLNKKNKNHETGLHLSVSKGYFKVVKALLDFGINIDIQDDQGYTALMRAIYQDKNFIAKYLVQKCADVNFKCYKSAVTALHLASVDGDSELVRLLLDSGANINSQNKFYETPVMLVSSEAALDEFLKIKDLDVNACDQDGKTVLMHCVENKFIKLHHVRALLAKGANKTIRNKYTTSAYEIASRVKQPADILELLGKIDNDTNHVQALRQVATGGSVGRVASLMRDSRIPEGERLKLISPSLGQKTIEDGSFWNYCIVGNLEGIRKLLTQRNMIDFNLRNKYGETAFSVACALGHTSVVRFLLKYFEDLSNYTPCNVDINSKNNDGVTPFQLACKYDRDEIASDLLGKARIEEVLSVKIASPKIEAIIKKTVENYKVKLKKDIFYNEEPTKKIIEDIENWQKEIADKNKKLDRSRESEGIEIQKIRNELFDKQEELGDREEEPRNIFDLVDKKEEDEEEAMNAYLTQIANEVTFNDILNHGRNMVNITNDGKQEA